MNIRPNALIIVENDGKILAERGFDEKKDQEFFRLIGGGIDFGETSLQTLKRELDEELGATLKSHQFVETIENIFEYKGKPGHEITFLYKGTIDEKFNDKDQTPILDKDGQYAQWVDTEKVKRGEVIIYPDISAHL